MSTSGVRECDFWAWDHVDYTVVRVTGFRFSCCPDHPGYWWIPELGFSMEYGSSLFDNKQDAIKTGLDSLYKQKVQVQEQIRKLEEMQ